MSKAMRPLDSTPVDDDVFIRDRISGKRVRSIAKARDVAQSDVLCALDRFAAVSVSDQTRRHTLGLELARFDALQETFYERAKPATYRVRSSSPS